MRFTPIMLVAAFVLFLVGSGVSAQRAAVSFGVAANDDLLIKVGVVEEILRFTVPARFNTTNGWRFSAITLADPLIERDPIDDNVVAAVNRTVNQWLATKSNPRPSQLTREEITTFLEDVVLQAKVGSPGLNTISGFASKNFGYVASLTQVELPFGKFANKTAYVVGYSFIPASEIKLSAEFETA